MDHLVNGFMDKLYDSGPVGLVAAVLLLGCVLMSGTLWLLWSALGEERKAGMEAVIASTKAITESQANLAAMKMALDTSTSLQERRLEILQRMELQMNTQSSDIDNVLTEVRRINDRASYGQGGRKP